MFTCANSAFPNECCGLLAGSVDSKGVAQVSRLYPLTNAAASPVEYVSAAKDMFAAVRDMQRCGIDIVAVYHSHPSTDAVPSQLDLERNYSPDVINLIISLKSGNPLMCGWWLTAQSMTEAEWQII